MRRLILFRHARAVKAADDGDDHARPLSAEGREEAGRMGAWLAGQGIAPDLVVCSTSLRTRETWRLAAEAFDPAPPVMDESLIYEASPETLLGLVQSVDGEVNTLLMVGHNPGFSQLAGLLAESAEPEVAARFERGFPPAGVAVLDFEDVPWAAIEEKTGWLHAFETPESLGFDE